MTNLEMADALEARADQDDAFEREIVNNGGAVSTRAKERTALDRAAAQKLRQMDEALKPFAAFGEQMIRTKTLSDDGVVISEWMPAYHIRITLTVGDLRAARAALGAPHDQ